MRKQIIALIVLLIALLLAVGVAYAETTLVNPITATVQGEGNNHAGADLFAPCGTPIYAAASGYIIYSEPGHTFDYGYDIDTINSVKIVMDEPLVYNGKTYVNTFYTHMSELTYDVKNNSAQSETIHVNAGDLIGYSGYGRGVAHLHISFETFETTSSDGWEHMQTADVLNVFGWNRGEDITCRESVYNIEEIHAISAAWSIDEFNASLEIFKSTRYGENSIYVNDPSGTGGYECFGFANELAKYMFGSYPTNSMSATSVNSGWVRTYGGNAVDSLVPGDIVRYRYHSIFITGVNGDTITYCDANNGSRYNEVHYNRTFSRSTLKSRVSEKLSHDGATTTGWVAHFTGGIIPPTPISCSCSTSYAGTYTCITTNYPLTIRSGHGTSYSAIGSIPSGAQVYVSKASGTGVNDWGHVSYNGIDGYASMEYLSLVPPTPSNDIDTRYPTPFKCYPLSSAQHAADAYSSINGSHIGYIYGTDFVTVKEVYTNGWCLVNTPWNGSTKDVYTTIGYFLNASCNPRAVVVESQATTYIRLYSSTELGWLDPNDKVYIVDDTYDQKQVIYPHTADGTYRCGWVYLPAHNHTPGAAATCTMPQVCTKCDAIIVNALGHAPGASATCTAAQTCTRCGIVIINALGHEPGSAATCTASQTCTRCGKVLANALGHTPGAAATCTTSQTCTRCGVVINNATGHTYSTSTSAEDAHPHKVFTVCTKCGDKKYTGATISKIGCTSCCYTVTYNANGGVNCPAAQSKIYGVGLVLTSEKPTKEGYTFAGWAAESTAQTAVYNAGDIYEADSAVTLYAVWVKAQYKVTYDPNGGTGAPSEQIKQKGVALVLSDSIPTYLGYRFMGWSTSSAAVSVSYQPSSRYTVDADIVLYAVWSRNVPVETISLNTTFVDLKLITGYKYYDLTYTVAPASATDKSVIWRSDDTSVVTVREGLLTAIGTGTANIYCTAADGSGVSAKCTVVVLDPKKQITIPSGTVEIEEEAFMNVQSITSVKADSNKLKTIGDKAFANCYDLQVIYIGSEVTQIASDAFYGCSRDMVFICDPDCYAAWWAGRHGFTVVAAE